MLFIKLLRQFFRLSIEGYQAWMPAGNMFLVLGSIPATSQVAQAGGPKAGNVAYMVNNTGAGDAYLAYGATSAAALSGAALPIVGGGGDRERLLYIKAGTSQVFTLGPLQFFCAIVPTGNAPLLITPGYGI